MKYAPQPFLTVGSSTYLPTTVHVKSQIKRLVYVLCDLNFFRVKEWTALNSEKNVLPREFRIHLDIFHDFVPASLKKKQKNNAGGISCGCVISRMRFIRKTQYDNQNSPS